MKKIIEELNQLVDVESNFLEICKAIKSKDFRGFDDSTSEIIKKLSNFELSDFFEESLYNGYLGQHYTPQSVVKLVTLLLPKEINLNIYDPTCGSGNLLVPFYKLKNNIYGQEYATTPLEIASILMENAILRKGNTIKNDAFSCEKFDLIVSNPPFNQKNWGLEELENDPRWQWGKPPKNNANYAWVSHVLSKLNKNGKAAIILPNGSLSGARKDEIEFRKRVLEDNKVEMIISLPDKLFKNTGIPVCIWLLDNDKKNSNVLFVDGSNIEGDMISKKQRVLKEQDILKICRELESFRKGNIIEQIGYSKSVSIEELKESDYSFVPGRYVGFVKEEINKEQLKQDIKESSEELKLLFAEFTDLIPQVEEAIEKALNYERS